MQEIMWSREGDPVKPRPVSPYRLFQHHLTPHDDTQAAITVLLDRFSTDCFHHKGMRDVMIATNNWSWVRQGLFSENHALPHTFPWTTFVQMFRFSSFFESHGRAFSISSRSSLVGLRYMQWVENIEKAGGWRRGGGLLGQDPPKAPIESPPTLHDFLNNIVKMVRIVPETFESIWFILWSLVWWDG